jgi:hypothetical protein
MFLAKKLSRKIIFEEWTNVSRIQSTDCITDSQQGVPYTATISRLFCVPIWLLIIPDLYGSNQQAPSSESGETWQEMFMNFAYEVSHTVGIFITFRKILRHGSHGITSRSKEVVLRIFISLKIHPHRPGLNPANIGSQPSTLTITPPMRLHWMLRLLGSWTQLSLSGSRQELL